MNQHIDISPKICPRCGDIYRSLSSLSRRDNQTDICESCGTSEAFNDWTPLNEMSRSQIETERRFCRIVNRSGNFKKWLDFKIDQCDVCGTKWTDVGLANGTFADWLEVKYGIKPKTPKQKSEINF